MTEAGGALNIARIAWSDDGAALVATTIPGQSRLEDRARRHRENGFVVDDDYAPLYAPLPVAHAPGDQQTWRIDARSGDAAVADGAETVYYEITHFPRYTLALTGSAPTDALDWSLNFESFRRAQGRALGLTWPDPAGGASHGRLGGATIPRPCLRRESTRRS